MTNIPCLVDDMLATRAREHVPVRDREREREVLPVRTMPAAFEQKCYLSQNGYGCMCVFPMEAVVMKMMMMVMMMVVVGIMMMNVIFLNV